MNYIKRFFVGIIVCILILLSLFIYVGYSEYKEAKLELPIEELVESIQEWDSYVSVDEISVDLKHAVVAIEDHRFYQHEGLDFYSIVRSAYYNFVEKKIVGGGSSITQQLAKNLYFDYTQSYTRKISEAFMAFHLESLYSKDEILTLYLNVIYYGDDYYGISEASSGYFNKTPIELTLFESSLLAGLPQSPSNYALSNHYDIAIIRQVDVLNAMLEHAYINEEEYHSSLEEQ